MQQSAIGMETLYRVQQCLVEGEQIVWTGKPEQLINLTIGSRFLHFVSKLGLPVFLICLVIGILANSQFTLLLGAVGLVLTSAVVLAMKSIRAAPVAFEVYALTNRRAFSYFSSNGTFILGSIPLDAVTSIEKSRCGRDCSSLIFKRPCTVAPTATRRPAGKEPQSAVGFINLKDADYPLKVAQWAAAQNHPAAA